MKLKFENISDSLVLSNFFRFTVAPYERRVGTQKRYGKDGGVITGDQRVNSRMISISFENTGENDDDYLSLLNQLVGFFALEKYPFYIVDTDNDRRAEIALDRLSDDPSAEGTLWRLGKNKIDFQMLDGHWEDYSEIEVDSPTGGINDGETITVNNNSDIECYPVITITPYDLNLEFTIQNNTTGAYTRIGHSIFSPGTIITIDCQRGIIMFDDGTGQTEISFALASGSGFIRLVAGNNTIQYNSSYGAADIAIKYRRRFAF